MESVWQRLGTRLMSLFDTIDAWRDRAQKRLDMTAGGPLRTWFKPVLLALAATAGLVGLLRLLLTAVTEGEVAGRWIGAAIAMLLALVLLVVVIRNVVISLVEPSQRRLLLLALLTSAAALLVGVEAFAAVTIALADHAPALWTVERFYIWQLVNSVPLLDIPGRLEWTEPQVLTGVTGRLLVLGFVLTVIPPLVRVGLALYGYIEGQAQQRRYSAALARRLRGRSSFTEFPELPWLLVLAAGAGAVWSVLNPHERTSMPVLSLTSVAFVATVIAVMAAAAIVAGFVFLWLTEQVGALPLAAAVGLVWFDSALRRALLPSVAELGLWGRIWVTLAVFVVLLVVVALCLWSEPEFTEAVLALVLVLGFIGAHAPAAQWLREHLTWQPWEFPVAGAAIAGCGWFTVAFLLRLLWRAARRPPVLGRSDFFDHSSGLRQDLRGYTLVAGHIVIAAGATLAVLRTLGRVEVSTSQGDRSTEASQTLHVAAWHVVDSLPGPDVPKVLDWRLTTDISGPWAGLVIIVAVAAIMVFAGLPLIRTVALWARLAAGRPGSAQALADVPGAVAANLGAVVDFLDPEARGEPLEADVTRRRVWPFRQAQITPSVAAERRLVEAELDRPRLLDLFGEASARYQTADRALARTTDAYRTYLKARGTGATSRSLFDNTWPRRERLGPKVAQARAAVNEYAEAVRRWDGSWRDTTRGEDSPPETP